MFGARKNEKEPVEVVTADPARPGAKNRPTPKRREAQAARLHPLVPADRKAAAQAAKQAAREERLKRQEAMARGEEWALLPRDRGPQRAYVRDVIDARFNVGEILLPLMVLAIPLMFLDINSTAARVGFSLVYGALAVFLIDALFLWFRVKKGIKAKFGEEPQRGTLFYVLGRTFAVRRTRIPAPRVQRGTKID